MVISRASIVRVRLRTALAVPDVAVTVNVKLPETVGVPEILPDEARTSPAGRLPLTLHVAPEGFDASVVLYGIPAMPVGIVLVVIVIVAGVGGVVPLTVIDSCFSALDAPDVALTVKREVPAFVGIHEIVPEVLRRNPAGRVPETTDHVTVDEFAASTAEYDAPIVPAGRLVVVIARVGVGVVPVIVMLSSFVALLSPNVALTVKREVPALVGTPEIVPEVLRVRPAGSVPEATDHLAPIGFDTRGCAVCRASFAGWKVSRRYRECPFSLNRELQLFRCGRACCWAGLDRERVLPCCCRSAGDLSG